MPIDIKIKDPRQCGDDELNTFIGMVEAGDQVDPQGLGQRVRESKCLLFGYSDDGQLAVVGALKKPKRGYRHKVFVEKARSDLNAEGFQWELGWVYVTPAFRGKRLGLTAVQKLVEAAQGSPIFATTGERSMKRYFDGSGFSKVGEPYPPAQGEKMLSLYVHGANHQ